MVTCADEDKFAASAQAVRNEASIEVNLLSVILLRRATSLTSFGPDESSNAALGATVGTGPCASAGAFSTEDGEKVGAFVGLCEGTFVAFIVGFADGAAVGAGVGVAEGISVGTAQPHLRNRQSSQ
jgi:hypothetical protein